MAMVLRITSMVLSLCTQRTVGFNFLENTGIGSGAAASNDVLHAQMRSMMSADDLDSDADGQENGAQPWLVLCARPNEKGSPTTINKDVLLRQVQRLRLVDMLQMSADEAYRIVWPVDAFHKSYASLLPDNADGCNHAEASKLISQAVDISGCCVGNENLYATLQFRQILDEKLKQSAEDQGSSPRAANLQNEYQQPEYKLEAERQQRKSQQSEEMIRNEESMQSELWEDPTCEKQTLQPSLDQQQVSDEGSEHSDTQDRFTEDDYHQRQHEPQEEQEPFKDEVPNWNVKQKDGSYPGQRYSNSDRISVNDPLHEDFAEDREQRRSDGVVADTGWEPSAKEVHKKLSLLGRELAYREELLDLDNEYYRREPHYNMEAQLRRRCPAPPPISKAAARRKDFYAATPSACSPRSQPCPSQVNEPEEESRPCQLAPTGSRSCISLRSAETPQQEARGCNPEVHAPASCMRLSAPSRPSSMSLPRQASLHSALAQMAAVLRAAKDGEVKLREDRARAEVQLQEARQECEAWRMESDRLWCQVKELQQQLQERKSAVWTAGQSCPAL